MKNIVERFISYTRIDTTSADDATTCPSTPNQFVLARQLEEELKELNLKDVHVDEHAFVYATLPANSDRKCPVVGFLAHMDTSNMASGADIKARIIENYDGGDIELSEGIYTRVREYPKIAELKGHDIIVTDGTTLLGGDDKAGIAIIMDAVQKLVNDPAARHGEIRICFTPDEEIGGGIHNIRLEDFPCDYAYTVDGGDIDEVTYENFNAATAVVNFIGNSIHPGDAKGKMINALQLAVDFHSMLPVFERPENTEGREGFNHIVSLQGECEKAQAVYIIRNHDADELERQKREFTEIAEHMNRMYGREVVDCRVNNSYRNMKEAFADRMYIIDVVSETLRQMGIEPSYTPIRGGTDGAQLTYMGIPTPNLGTGGLFCHGNHEMVSINNMKKMSEIVFNLILNIEKRG
ncbi:MAG: peptidase T [Erysipelotrichaceae bacterium]|nr:peptidase T [Erysipelotrichaceae bacterium]